MSETVGSPKRITLELVEYSFDCAWCRAPTTLAVPVKARKADISLCAMCLRVPTQRPE